MPRRSSFFPLNENADVRAATCRPGSCVSALMISSAMPSLKYSFSGSVLMFANGSTAIEVGALPPPAAGAGGESASRKRAIVANRSAGSRAMAMYTAASTCRGREGMAAESRGGALVNRCTRIASIVAPVNGGSPVSISKSMLASE